MAQAGVSGAEQFLALSKRLKSAGELGLRRELNSTLRKVGKPMTAVAKQGFRSGLPKRGGLNEFYAAKRINVTTKTGTKTYGIGIAVAKADQRFDTEGRLAHPVFFRAPKKRTVVVQRVRPGIFSGSMQAAAPLVRAELQTALDDFSGRVVG